MTLKYINYSVDMYGTSAITANTYQTVFTGDEDSVQLKFSVTDEEDLTGATALIHLYFGDSSHIERVCTPITGGFQYTLTGTENDHAGVTRVDIYITKAGAKFTRAGYKFRIDKSLEASAPLVEYAVETVDTVVKEAGDWLLQAQTDFGTAQDTRAAEWVTDNDTRADEFTAAQTSRATTFGESEASRASTFNTNETGRSNTFITNENARQAAAEANQAQAATDHTTAEADHDIAIADSSMASSDHATATTDHSTAVIDHSTASADHTAALADQEIVDGLQDQFNDVIANATVDSEVINARQGSATLSQNLLSIKSELAQIVPQTTLWFLEKINTIRTRAIISFQGFYDIDENVNGKYRVIMVDGTETWSVVTVGAYSFKISDDGYLAPNKTLTTDDKKLKVMPKDDKVNVKMFGATGDKLTDDTRTFQSAINSHYHVVVPIGGYLVRNLIPSKGLILEGVRNAKVAWAGELYPYQNSELIGNGVAGDYVVKNTIWSGENKPNSITLKRLTINGNNKTQNGVLLGDSSYVEDCEITQCDKGVTNLRTGSKVKDCEFHKNNTGLERATDSKLLYNVFQNNVIGAHLINSNDNDVIGNRFEWNTDTGLVFESAVFNKMPNNTMDRNANYGLKLINVTNLTGGGNVIERNLVNNIYIDGMTECNIDGNQLIAKNTQDDQTGEVLPQHHIKIVSAHKSSIARNIVTGNKMFDPVYQYKSLINTDGNIVNGVGDTVTTNNSLTIPASTTQSFTIPYPPGTDMWSAEIVRYKVEIDGNPNHYVQIKDIEIRKFQSNVTVYITNSAASSRVYKVYLTFKKDMFYL